MYDYCGKSRKELREILKRAEKNLSLTNAEKIREFDKVGLALTYDIIGYEYRLVYPGHFLAAPYGYNPPENYISCFYEPESNSNLPSLYTIYLTVL